MSELVLVVSFVSVTNAIAGAQLIVILPSPASPSLSVNVFVWADDQVVASETLKWPFGAVVTATIEPAAAAELPLRAAPRHKPSLKP